MPTLNIEAIARVCHNLNRAVQQDLGEESIPVAPVWEEASNEQKTGVMQGVMNIVSGVVATPEESHQLWCANKRDHGWRFGIMKDEALKTHPCLVEYSLLGENQKIKDSLFFALVDSLKIYL